MGASGLCGSQCRANPCAHRYARAGATVVRVRAAERRDPRGQVVQSSGPPRGKRRAREDASANDDGAPVEANQKLWGGRFSEATSRAVEAYTSSVDIDERMLSEDIRASIAHARMLGRQQIIPSADAER